jgi:beta-phosphoglucomutase-like phosphatase (HAD superfamily)
LHDLVPAGITAVLCDADGTLFPSEEPAFAASAEITRELMQRYGLSAEVSPETLRRASTGRNFRDTTRARLADAGISISAEDFEEWVRREKEAVTAHLAETLVGDADVLRAVKNWAQRYRLAVVSSSAMSRVAAGLEATGLSEYFPVALRFSAEDSLDRPRSKPDPAVYRYALARIGCPADSVVAIEDSVSGTTSAVAAGITTLGVVQFAPVAEQGALGRQLLAAGASAVADRWSELEHWL